MSRPKRFSVTLGMELEKIVGKEAESEERSVAGHIVWIVRRYYRDRKREADLFIPPRLHEESLSDEPQFFQTPATLPAESESKLREKQDR